MRANHTQTREARRDFLPRAAQFGFGAAEKKNGGAGFLQRGQHPPGEVYSGHVLGERSFNRGRIERDGRER